VAHTSPGRWHTHDLSGLGLSAQAASRAQHDEPQATKAKGWHSPNDSARAHIACTVHNKKYGTVRRPQARVALPHGKTPNFTITRWLLPKEAATGRPPSLAYKRRPAPGHKGDPFLEDQRFLPLGRMTQGRTPDEMISRRPTNRMTRRPEPHRQVKT
jgi:hypothetical protein